MATHDERGERAQTARALNITPIDCFAASMNWIEEYFTAQVEAAEAAGEVAAQWFGRIETEAVLAEELTSHLAAACSFADTITAVHDWASRRLTLMADDGKHLLTDMRRFSEAQKRLSLSGWMRPIRAT